MCTIVDVRPTGRKSLRMLDIVVSRGAAHGKQGEYAVMALMAFHRMIGVIIHSNYLKRLPAQEYIIARCN